ncbi:hypothetical protein GIB67_023552 [Kingdonia uniflora]|uniref:Uncharacterized protein n=1 Tax=Kingdonia uniflora TaxID=39325 RepID=A0A7J7N2V5_9MAGN|nr:hypothetical protein GIB67_020424 [Kingdonia uniflora]KAF6176261.1 hypothetical protein GIB67_023552 [Kingdonia uniflora]
MRRNLLEAIAKVHGDGGVVSCNEENGLLRMKIVVRKQDLKHMLEMVRGKNNNKTDQSSIFSLEQRLQAMRKRRLKRAEHVKACGSNPWQPALLTIPEES